jgi:hypothetical protein
MADIENENEEGLFMACFEDIAELLDVCEEQDGNINQNFIESVINQLESAVKFVENVLPSVNECRDAISEVGNNLKLLYHVWCRKLQELWQRSNTACTHLAVFSISPPGHCISAGPGRPKYNIDEEVLLNLRTLGFKWKEIAQLLLVSRWTIWRRVRELDIVARTGFSDIGNDQLDDIVRAFMNVQGILVGYSMVQGHLRNMNIKIQRDRIRASIKRVDPRNSRLRWATVVSRRSYSVAGPNSLWHIDGHHSLITWGFVMHGCIDGYSRLICFLKCATNNRSETVERLFLQSVEKHSWPSRIRTDHGGENVLVWQQMIAMRGENRGSVLVGSSTRNQRIERLWRDVFRCFGNVFYYTFQSMETSGLLDITNPLHMFILHYVYLPRINTAIESFVDAWNKHPIRTERNWTPEQIWSNGMMNRVNERLTAVVDVRGEREMGDDDLQWYGTDTDGPIPPDNGLNTVEVNDVEIEIPEDVMARLTNEVNPLHVSGNFGIDIFQRGVALMQANGVS